MVMERLERLHWKREMLETSLERANQGFGWQLLVGCSQLVWRDVAAAQCMQCNASNQDLHFFSGLHSGALASSVHADSAGINHPHHKRRVIKQGSINPNAINVLTTKTDKLSLSLSTIPYNHYPVLCFTLAFTKG